MTLLPETAAWTARDWRRMVGIVFLGAGGIASTVVAWRALTLLADKSTGPWPVAYFSYGCLVLIGIVLTGLSAILGRRTFKMTVAGNVVESVGDDPAERGQNAAEDG